MQESEPRSLIFHIPVGIRILDNNNIIYHTILYFEFSGHGCWRNSSVYVAGGISIAFYASIWSDPPDGCEAIRDLEIQDPCI